jgi:hypothetical protein
MKSVLIGCLFVGSLLGCQKKEDKPVPPPVVVAVPPPAASVVVVTPEPAAASAAASAAQPAAAASDRAAKIPVQEDFEKQAKATVTKPTLKQEVDKLEKEIGK